MKNLYKAIAVTLIAFPPLSANATESKNKLTCEKLNSPLIHNASGIVTPYCNPAEIACRALDFLEERPKNDKLRLDVEDNLRKEVRHKLDLCEIALRKTKPKALPER